jgi:hypothetical protein
MTLHKLTAGDGYTYLTRQVAAHDATERGPGSLGDYYSERGEAPGIWMGRGLAGVPDFPVGEQVTEAHMVALFGQGRHPNAVEIERAARLAGKDQQVDQASRLGAPFRVFDQANEFRRRCADRFREYNRVRGLNAVAPVAEEDRAQIRTAVASAMFVESYGRPPADARELSGHLARISRQATTAVAGYDLTFSPVKSVSTLWAVAAPEVAAVIEQAHADAVADTIAWLEDHAIYTRIGRNGVAQVEVRGLIAAAFTHRDSRAGDPDLHSHVAISNKVQTLDGRWLALDGRPIYKNKVAASERYNTRLEALVVDRLAFASPTGPARSRANGRCGRSSVSMGHSPGSGRHDAGRSRCAARRWRCSSRPTTAVHRRRRRRYPLPNGPTWRPARRSTKPALTPNSAPIGGRRRWPRWAVKSSWLPIWTCSGVEPEAANKA